MSAPLPYYKIKSLSFATAIVLVACVSVEAGNLTFNTINGFESPQTVGSQPAEFHDIDTGWIGEVTIEDLASEGISPGPAGGSQFAKVVPGPDDSYDSGLRNGPYAHVGASQAYPPISADQYSFVVDIFAQSTASSTGDFTWQTGVNDSDDTGAGDIVMTEAGFNITPGASTWNFVGRLPSPATSVDLATGAWYTLEVEWDRSGSDVFATTNVWQQGQRGIGVPLYTSTGAPDDDRFSGTQAAPSADMGGPRYSWFTVWDNTAVDAVYIDNSGTAAIPEPATVALLGIGGMFLLGRNRRAATKGSATS